MRTGKRRARRALKERGEFLCKGEESQKKKRRRDGGGKGKEEATYILIHFSKEERGKGEAALAAPVPKEARGKEDCHSSNKKGGKDNADVCN